MTRVRVYYEVRRSEDDVVEIDAHEDDIDTHAVLDALREFVPFDEIESDSLDWEVLPDEPA